MLIIAILCLLAITTIEACPNGLLCDETQPDPTPLPTPSPLITSKLEFENVILFEYGKKAEIILKEGNDATQDTVCVLQIDYEKRQTAHLNFKHCCCENDETRSLQITRALAGTKIRLFDNPDGHRNDDWVEITILKDFTTTKTINSYQSYNNAPENQAFIKVELHWKNGLDGKVSRIEIEPPPRVPDPVGFIDTRFDAAANDRSTKFVSTVGRFDTVDTSISSLQTYLKTEIDAQSTMINTRFGESTSNVNYQFTTSTDNINNQFTSSTNNINNQFTVSTNNINNQFTFSTNNINNQFELSTNNINNKYNSLSTQITTRMNSLSHNMNQNFTTSTANINYQFGVSTNNINQKYNLLENQMNVQSAMITTRFNTLAYGLRKNISLTMKIVREGNVDIINEIQATTNELKFQFEQDINHVNETVNYIQSKVYDQREIIQQIQDAIDNLNYNMPSGKAEMNIMIEDVKEKFFKYDEKGLIVFKIKPSYLYIFITVIVVLNVTFMGFIIIVCMKCFNGYHSVPYNAKI